MPGFLRRRPANVRLVVGGGLLVLSLLPYLGAVLVPFLGMSAARSAALIGGLVVGAEIIGALAMVVLGKEAYLRIKSFFAAGRAKRKAAESTSPLRSSASNRSGSGS